MVMTAAHAAAQNGHAEALRVLHDTHERGEFATGLIYVQPMADDFLTTLNLVDEPLASLSEDRVRPPESVLTEIMESLA